MTNLCLNLPITHSSYAKHGAKSIVAEVQFLLLNGTCNLKFCHNEIWKPNLYKHVDKLTLEPNDDTDDDEFNFSQ